MLEIQGLTRRFGDNIAIEDVSFDVPDGKITGFVGANGAGKTTTMRIIMGILAAHAGEVRWAGRPIRQSDRRDFGYMPEERGLYPKQPVLDQLIYLGEVHGMTKADGRASASRLLERFGLGERLKDPLEKLSLGNQQRVQIVAALMTDPIAMVLDEPFSGLDPVAVDAMVDVLREHTSGGAPVLFSSHQLDLVDRLCDQIVVLSKGRVVARGTSEELRQAGPERFRLGVGGDAGWVRDVRGLRVLDVDGNSALVEITEPGARDTVLREAMARGEVTEFSKIVPTLSEIYREVTA